MFEYDPDWIPDDYDEEDDDGGDYDDYEDYEPSDPDSVGTYINEDEK